MNRYFRDIFFPPFEILRPIPPLAWVPASIIFWPTTELSIAFVTFLGAFTARTIYETPYQAMAPDLTPDYDQRTRVATWRVCRTYSASATPPARAFANPGTSRASHATTSATSAAARARPSASEAGSNGSRP